MLKIPDKIKPLVSDYKMNLVEIKKSNTMKFHNDDVNMVFDLSRSIYERNYDKINRVYKDCAIPTEIGLVIGAITESQELINQALESVCIYFEFFGFYLFCSFDKLFF